MALRVPGRRTVTVVRRVRQTTDDGTEWARDSRGDPVFADERTEVHGCSVQPTGLGLARGSEEGGGTGREQVSTSFTIYAPTSWPTGATGAVEFDGQSFEVQGEPQLWAHPRLGHVVVSVRRTNG